MGYTHFTGPVVSFAGFVVGDQDAATGVYGGGGTNASPLNLGSTANQNMLAYYATTSAATGDTRLQYSKLTFTGAGSGETLRAFSVVSGATAAVGGTVNGAHISLSVGTGGAISGAGNALRATLGAAAGVTMGGTVAAIQADSDFNATATVPATAAFIRVTDSNTTKMPNLLNLPAPSAGTIFQTQTAAAVSHCIKINAAGTTYYIMVSDTL